MVDLICSYRAFCILGSIGRQSFLCLTDKACMMRSDQFEEDLSSFVVATLFLLIGQYIVDIDYL